LTTTAELIDKAKQAGFVCTEDPGTKQTIIIGNNEDLRRFYMLTVSPIIMQQLVDDAQAMGLYDK
jgi:hypothetical protein